MNYTPNHHLPQWVKSDRIMMDDFNAAMASIESGMSANAQAAAAARSVANTAQSAANTALSSKPYAVGTYTGTGADLNINLGFRPSFVIINGLEDAAHTQILHFGYYSCVTAGTGVLGSQIVFTSTGFQVAGSGPMPNLSQSGHVYEYIAFK